MSIERVLGEHRCLLGSEAIMESSLGGRLTAVAHAGRGRRGQHGEQSVLLGLAVQRVCGSDMGQVDMWKAARSEETLSRRAACWLERALSIRG